MTDESGRPSTGADVQRMAELARELRSQDDLEALLTDLVLVAAREIPGATHAGITVIGPAGDTAWASTDAFVGEVDSAQHATGEGPCLAAAHGEPAVVRIDSMATERRWPRFAGEADRLDAGVPPVRGGRRGGDAQ